MGLATIGFGICLILSLGTLTYMLHKNYDSVQIHYWSIILLNPVIILAYFLKSEVTTPEGARMAFCFTNLDGTALVMLYVFAMLRGLGLKPKPIMKTFCFAIVMIHLGVVWYCFNNKLYYASMTVIPTDYGNATKMTSGPLKIVHLIYFALVALIIISIIIAGIKQKGKYSLKTLITYSSMVFVGIVIYLIESLAGANFSVLPYLYTAIGILIAADYDNLLSHNISSIATTFSQDQTPNGYMALSFKKTLLCKNDNCTKFLPFLEHQKIDAPLDLSDTNAKIISDLIDDFKAGGRRSAEFTQGDMSCICEVSYFSVRKQGKKTGYFLDIRDATDEKRNLMILTDYNQMLNEEVAEKTEHINYIQRKIVLGMADMIENRDNNTGGHVKRTSEVIGILVDEIVRQGHIKIDEQKASDIVRAAPMHDLGKLQIDSSILCKPGKLTDEEFAIMKTHSTKSGELVKILLQDVEEEHFVNVAFNVARFHHERWDGKGYPEGRVGSTIPVEARIMAVADVYDALVSKRCYKEPMSFEKAAEIMESSMGTQFDPNMKPIFMACRERLEEYYRESYNQ